MKHKHHIIPKHIGGNNGPTIELSVHEHAEAHRVLYEKHGRWQDKLAWLGLSGQISKTEIIHQKIKEGGRKGGFATRDKGHLKKLLGVGGKIGGKKCISLGKAGTQTQSTCPHCGKTGQTRAIKRWHFDNCPKIGGSRKIKHTVWNKGLTKKDNPNLARPNNRFKVR